MLRLLGILALGNMLFGDSRHCRHGGFLSSLLFLPVLMLGGWMAVAIAGSVLSLIGVMIGGIFSGLESVASDVFSGNGIVPGIVIGLAAFCYFRSRNAQNAAEADDE